MFLITRPSAHVLNRFLEESQDLPLSYESSGSVRAVPPFERVDELVAVIGHGQTDFERARLALMAWKHFDIGWVRTAPADASIACGTVVAVLIRHLGFWSLNGCRVLYHTSDNNHCFGFAYGTLISHAESGEEVFEVRLDPSNGNVTYHIRAMSRPRAWLARAGQPIVRLLQARFRRDSADAMKRAIRDGGPR